MLNTKKGKSEEKLFYSQFHKLLILTSLKKIQAQELKCHTKNKYENGLNIAKYFINLGYLALSIDKIPGILTINKTLFNSKIARNN